MEKKDWEKELEEIVNNIDIKKTPSEGDWIDKQYKSATKNVLIEFIKQLLEEREMMVYHEKTISNMENWKERFEYIYVIEENKGEKYLRKYDHTTIVEELEYFISLELDKAREEGRKEKMIPIKDEDINVGKLKELASDNYGKDTPEGRIIPIIGEVKPMSKKEWKEFQKEMVDTTEELKEGVAWLKQQEKEKMIPIKDEDINVGKLKELASDNYGKDTPEEWVEELEELLDMHNGIKSSEWETLKTNVVYQVKQLLSERTFTEKELRLIFDCVIHTQMKPIKEYEEEYKGVLEKVSKLLLKEK